MSRKNAENKKKIFFRFFGLPGSTTPASRGAQFLGFKKEIWKSPQRRHLNPYNVHPAQKSAQ